jgi:hypothetical protein
VSLGTVRPIDVISDYICKLDTNQIELRLFAVDEVGQDKKNDKLINSSSYMLKKFNGVHKAIIPF